MGSHMKKAIFEEQTAKALKKWHQIAKERNKKRKAGKANSSDPGFLSGGENSPSIASSPIHLLGKYKNKSDQPDVDIESVMNSPMSYLSDTEHSEIELGSASTHNNRHNIEVEDEDLRLRRNDGELHDRDFSFVKP